MDFNTDFPFVELLFFSLFSCSDFFTLFCLDVKDLRLNGDIHCFVREVSSLKQKGNQVQFWLALYTNQQENVLTHEH